MRRTRYKVLLMAAAALLTGCGTPESDGWYGYVEGEYVYVAAPIAGGLTNLAVQRGSEVVRGTLLFELDAEVERAAREQAAATVSSMLATAENLGTGKRAQEIAVIESQLQQAQAQAVQANAELEREQRLVAQGFVSGSRLDDARAKALTAAARVAESQASLRVARLPARSQERAAALANSGAARAALEQAQWRESQKRQSATEVAQVADTFFRQGEWVGAGQPVVSLLPPGNIKVRFYVPESELARITVGEQVSVHCDGCISPLLARISFIATQAEYTPPVIYSNAQRARLVFMIEARPEPGGAVRLRPGQPVDVRPQGHTP